MRATLILFIVYFIFVPLSATAENQTVIISEVAWMGTTASANDEWIELHNTTDAAIDVTGWKLQTTDGGLLVELIGSITANGYYLLERTDDDTVPDISADTIYTGSLSNTGETLVLIDTEETVIDRLDASTGWTAGDNITKQTLERATDSSWQTSTNSGGTPKTKNSDTRPIIDTSGDAQPTSTSTPSASPTAGSGATTSIKRDEIVFTEVLPNPAGTDTDEFIEFKNVSMRSIDITGWTVETSGGQRYTLPSLTMYPGSIVVFDRNTTRLALRNDKEKIVLLAPGQKNISQVEWKKSAPEARSYQRSSDGSYMWDMPTPGEHSAIEPITLPTAIIAGPIRAAVGDIIAFDGSDSFDPLNRALTLRWQFSDGRIAYGPTARQLFTIAGKYEVSLTAFINEQSSSTEVLKITVTGNATTSPTAQFITSTNTVAVFDNVPEQPMPTANIFISEFSPNPNGSDNQEFIELFNADTISVNLGGWQLDDAIGGSRPYRIPNNASIGPGEYQAFYKTETRLALNNDHDEVHLLSPSGEELDVVAYEEVREGTSYVRTEDNDWQQTDTPTPNELNILSDAQNNSASTTGTSSPQVLGAETAEQISPPAQRRMLRYVISGAVIFAVLGITVASKKYYT